MTTRKTTRFVRAVRGWTLALLPALLSTAAIAQPVLVTSNTSLSPSDVLFPGTAVPVATAEVTVQSATLTISGEVTIASLTVNSGGVVTHLPGFTYDADPGPAVNTVGGFHLHTIGNVSIAAGGAIDVSGKGQASGQGLGAGASIGVNECAGGGGYGGSGGNGFSVLGGGTYGSYSQPVDLGSGGGASTSFPGKRGGGAIRLSIAGSLTINGEISADGDQYDGTPGGGGSGGSIWITAGTVTGTGSIHANGRGYTNCTSGGGGGGRVAVYGDLSTLSTTALLARSAPVNGAGCGTVYRAQTGQPAQLIFDNSGNSSACIQSAPLVTPANVNVIIRNGATLSHAPGSAAGLSIQIADNLTIEANAAIDVGGMGHASGQGPGAGASVAANECAGGGGHGGSGGNGFSVPGGGTYGSFSQPIDLGSGGGASTTFPGKRGGGAARIIIGGTLTVNGEIAADGAPYDGTPAGGGSGGSIWITAATVNGTGTIHANGRGYTNCTSGGGSGGRVAVYGDLSALSATAVQARSAPVNGAGCGTVYRAQTNQSAQLIFDNGGTVAASALAAPLNVPTGVNVFIRNGASLSHAPGNTSGLTIQVADNLTVEANGAIDVGGMGYAGGQGPGAGVSTALNECAGGGGHGGSGGSGLSVLGGGTYGSFSQPTDLGSGGGASSSFAGKRGGGAARVIVGGTLTVNGEIAADGQAYDGTPGGGGSGGSVWVTAGAVTGSGTIHANGRGYTSCTSGGGGGGRVAVYGDLSGLSTTALQARGAPVSGAPAGSVYRAQTSQPAQLIFDNGGNAAASAVTAPIVIPAGVNVIIRNGASLSHAPGNTSGLTIQVADNLTVEASGSIDVSGKGFDGGQGPGAGPPAVAGICADGGGHGGSGGAGVTNSLLSGGGTYGSFSQPATLGSGGGASGTMPGKRGGGALRLSVGGTLTINGEIASDGEAYNGTPSGGGAGGSIWITAGAVSGGGLIHANGRGYSNCSSGGGGGGRVAIYGDLSALIPFALQARSAPTNNAGCGTIYRAQPSQPAQLIFDNGGAASSSALSEPLITPANVNVIIRSGAALSHSPGSASGLAIQIADNLTIEAGASIDVSSKGYAGGAGPGAGASAEGNTCAGGGAYGGAGGAGTSVAGGTPYGSAAQPVELGSGGGASSTTPGKRGGGRTKLSVGGVLTVNGEISADGEPYNGTGGGGGSGGSIWITAANVSGSGTIHANGRGYSNCANGGGGGGRIAVYGCGLNIPLANLASHGATNGAEGTVYFDATGVAVVAHVVSSGRRCPGATVALTADTIGGTSFQWRRNGVPMVDGPGFGNTTYAGTSTQTLTVTNVSPVDGAAEITVRVANACGMVTGAPPIHLVCSGDFNCSGTLSVQDIFDFLNAWFAGNPTADFNSGGLAVQDIFDFLNAWFAGC
jgi:hypothetical protein